MRTEKRYANVGERILITNGEPIDGQDYENGDILTVREAGVFGMGDVMVEESITYVDYFEYEVIIEEPTQASTYNENLVLTRLFNAEAEVDKLSRSIDELQRRIEALEKANDSKYVLDELIGRFTDGNSHIPKPKTPTCTANQRRADVIKRAEAFVKKYDSFGTTTGRGGFRVEGIICDAEFIVNPEKRTVVCLLKGQIGRGLMSKGIAKCMDDDVFNADIGKAIALAKARGRVPDRAFRYAPQPTEVVVGMRVESKYSIWDAFKVAKILTSGTALYGYDGTWTNSENAIIIDDSEAEYV